MNNGDSESMLRPAKRATLGAVGISLVTSVHHAYGAYIYNTPWRHHAAVVSMVATAVIAASFCFFQKRSGHPVGTVALWIFIVVTFMVLFLGFGVFEGVYNHGVKDALYFAHASPDLMRRLFPPPTYEMPNNAFFEVTGVLQIVPGIVTGYYLYRFLSERQKLRRAISESHAKVA
jgi:hypothetical protein